MGVTEENFEMIMAGKHSPEKKCCSLSELYDETPIFILVDIAEDVVELVAQELSRSLGPGGMDMEALQG